MAHSYIHSEADLDAALAALGKADPRFVPLLAQAGRPPLRRRKDGFAALIAIIVAQQLSTASANAIWGRLEAAFDPFEPDAILKARPAGLARLRAVRTQNPRHKGDRARGQKRRAAACRPCRDRGRRRARRADRRARDRSVDRRHLSAVQPGPCRRLAGRRSRAPGSRTFRVQAPRAADGEGNDGARGSVAALACGGRAHFVVVLPDRDRRQTAREAIPSVAQSHWRCTCTVRWDKAWNRLKSDR